MAVCGYSNNVDGPCGASLCSPADLECVPLQNCKRDIRGHLRALDIRDSSLKTESDLLLARAGIFETDEGHLKLTVCPRHREKYGTRWRCNKRTCSIPADLAFHKSNNTKGDRAITSSQSKILYSFANVLVPVGSPICKRCREQITCALASPQPSHNVDDLQPLPVTPQISRPVHSTDSRTQTLDQLEDVGVKSTESLSSDSLNEAFHQLTVRDDPSFILSDSGSTGSTASSNGTKGRIPALSRKKLNEFLSACGRSDKIIGQPKKAWQDMSMRARKTHVSKAGNAIVSALEVITPGDAGSLWKAVQSSHIVEETLGVQSPVDMKYLEALAETYRNAAGWDTRRQVLAIMADLVPLAEIQKFIPGLTEYRFKVAKLHILKHGRGAAVPVSRTPRVRIDDFKLDHFLEFITSPHVIQDLPFGQRYLRLSNGSLLETPNVIRCMIPSRICAQYRQYCEERGIKPFSEATMRRLLTVCAATVRKSLQGLDYISAEGAKAFDELTDVVSKLENNGRDHAWVCHCEKVLKEGKQYIKTDYKVHVRENSSIADHCLSHALSYPEDAQLDITCKHQHDHQCSSCEELNSVLDEIETAITDSANSLTPDQYDDITYTFRQANLAINAWKSHQLRSIQQDKARIELFSKLEPNEVFITQDWAMKFLPQKYRETQADWFGKRGISWHISVIILKSSSGVLLHQTLVHVFEKCSQDSDAVIPIMEHTLRCLKAENKELTKAYYRQDNAGCYHSAAMLTACHLMKKATGIKVERVDFSDPQGGKGPCDRKAATIKAHIRRYINEGHDVQTATDLCNAILSRGGVRGVRVALIDSNILPIPAVKLVGISTLNNFQFSAKGLTYWKAYKIGEGKMITWSKLHAAKTLGIETFNSSFSEGTFIEITSKPKSQTPSKMPEEEDEEDEEENEEDEDDHREKLFTCPNEGCVKVFQRYTSLDNHLQYGKCQLKEEKASLFDKAKVLYHDKLLHGQGPQPGLKPQTTDAAPSNSKTQKQGWALKKAKTSARFTKKQRQFLDEMFFRGQETGHKMNPSTVARDMRYAKDFDGTRIFKVDEFLSPSQVQSYFSRTATKLKKGTLQEQGEKDHKEEEEEERDDNEEDLEAAEDEAAYSQARSTIVDECNLKHPIVYESVNLCQLFANSKLTKLSIAFLQLICEDLELDTSGILTRRKAPYIETISNVLKTCSCVP